MGCVTSCHKKRRANSRKEDPVYSWSHREEIDGQEFRVEDCVDETVVRLPDSISGKPFSISNCLKSNILLLDHMNSVTITDCRDCVFLIGPTKGSLLIQNCTSCRILCACMQVRCRDCSDLTFSLFSSTSPSIESSHGLQFACLSLTYHRFEEQLESASLCPFNNNWYQVYDFNAFDDGDESHWALTPQQHVEAENSSSAEGRLFTDVPMHMEISLHPQRSSVPVTAGLRSVRDFVCLVVLFSDGSQKSRARVLINTLTPHPFSLIRSRQLIVSKILEEQVFQDDKYSNILFHGPVIALEFASCLEACCDVAEQEIRSGIASEDVVYISPTPEVAAEQLELLFNATA